MNWAQFEDPVSHMCFASTVVASWSITQQVAGLSLFTVMTNIFSLNSVKTFRENSIKGQAWLICTWSIRSST